MTGLRVIGIDPGPVPGIVRLDFAGKELVRADVLQCTAGVAAEVLSGLLVDADRPVLVGVEQFVVRGRAARSSAARAGTVTRDLIPALRAAWADHDATTDGRRGGRWLTRPAGRVKPWATDARLQQTRVARTEETLWLLTAGMRHARDAARHALYAAVHDGAIPDPLSRGAHR